MLMLMLVLMLMLMLMLILLILVHCGFRRIPIRSNLRNWCLVIGGHLRLRVAVWVWSFTRVSSLSRSGADDSIRAHSDQSASGRDRVRGSECWLALMITGDIRCGW